MCNIKRHNLKLYYLLHKYFQIYLDIFLQCDEEEEAETEEEEVEKN